MSFGDVLFWIGYVTTVAVLGIMALAVVAAPLVLAWLAMLLAFELFDRWRTEHRHPHPSAAICPHCSGVYMRGQPVCSHCGGETR